MKEAVQCCALYGNFEIKKITIQYSIDVLSICEDKDTT